MSRVYSVSQPVASNVAAKPSAANRTRTIVSAAYASVVILFLWFVTGFYVPGKGFTYLVMFGAEASERYLPEIKALPHYEIPRSIGYDGAYYAQLAIRPTLGDPDLRPAIDNLPYRARRMLFCWSAYLLGGGQPGAVLQIYAVQNILGWCALAALLLRWFPATSWDNFTRWCAVLFSFGLCFSLRAALMDGPSLLLISVAATLIERGRRRAGGALLAVSGLAKETNLLAAPLLAPAPRTRAGFVRFAGQAVIVMAPLILWVICLRVWLGESTAYKGGNFALPLTAYIAKWREIIAQLGAPEPVEAARANLLVIVGLTVQCGYFLARPDWRNPWWRIGAAYAGFMLLLGPAVWAGHPTAAARVVLPMTLAFNIALPRAPRWWVVLLLGNISVFASPKLFDRPAVSSYYVTSAIAASPEQQLQVLPDANWYEPERSLFERWNWSKGNAALTLRNPHAFAVSADLEFTLRTVAAREVRVFAGDRELARETLPLRGKAVVELREITLPPGDTLVRFTTDTAAQRPKPTDPREVAFSVRDFEVKIRGRAPP